MEQDIYVPGVAKTYGGSSIPIVNYVAVPLKNILVHRQAATHNAPGKIVGMEIKGVDNIVNCSGRFINSFLSLFGLSNSIFNLFDHEEVVERLLMRGRGDMVRVALQHNKDDTYTALAAIKPSKPYVDSFDLYDLLKKMEINDEEIHYTLGVVRSSHQPSVLGNNEVNIAGDSAVRRFVMDVPIDGYGNPSAYLSIIRQVCSNGAIGEAPAFRSQVNIGDTNSVINGNIISDAIPTIKKFIQSHNNEEGFHILTERMRTAAKTPASLDEFSKLYKLLTGTNMDSIHRKVSATTSDLSSDVNQVMYNLAGKDLMEKYGLVSLDQISPKKRKLVPVECTVMDLVNVASELSTHRANDYQSKRISGFIGQTLSEEYDLEGAETLVNKSTDLYMVSYKDAHANDDKRKL